MKKNKYSKAGFLFVLPSFIFFLFVFLYPLILCFVNSLFKVNFLMGTRSFTGFSNFEDLFSRKSFWESVLITLKFVVMSVPLLLIIDLYVANALAFLKGDLQNVLSTIVFIPFTISMISAGIVWDWLLDPNLGLVNNVLQSIGLDNTPLWLRDPRSALYSTLIITVWIRSPFGIMILLGGIQNVPQSLYEVAELDGAKESRKFFNITVPLINPQLIMVLTLETIFAFRAFDQIYGSTGGGPAGATRTIMIYLVKDLFTNNYGLASALTVVLIFTLFLISLCQQLFLRKNVDF